MALDQETINAQLDLLAAHRRTLAHLLHWWQRRRSKISPRLLALNLERAAGQGEVSVAVDEQEDTDDNNDK